MLSDVISVIPSRVSDTFIVIVSIVGIRCSGFVTLFRISEAVWSLAHKNQYCFDPLSYTAVLDCEIIVWINLIVSLESSSAASKSFLKVVTSLSSWWIL